MAVCHNTRVQASARSAGHSPSRAAGPLYSWSPSWRLGWSHSISGRSQRPPGWVREPSSRIGALLLLADLSMIATGLAAWVVGYRSRMALLAVLIGLVGLAPYVVASRPGGPISAPFAAAIEAWLVPIVLVLVLALTGGSDRGGLSLAAIAGLLVTTIVVSLLRAMTYDPFYEPACTCAHGSPLVAADATLRGGVRLGGSLVAMVTAVAVVAPAALGLRRIDARDYSSRVLMVSAVAFGTAAFLIAAIASADELAQIVQPASVARSVVVVLSAFLAIAMLGMAAGVGASALADVRSRLRIRGLAATIESAPTPAHLQQALGDALGDPDLRVGYWVGDAGRYVDGEGVTVPDTSPSGTATTFIERGGSPLAMIRHRPRLDDTAISREFRPGMLLALDNARLRAAGLAHLRELQASRAGIVEIGDRERRRIERDLHDGAQQGLLALAFDLRVARLAAERDNDAQRAAGLAGGEIMAIEAGEELRRVARGAHPAVLSQAGLAAALASLADETPIPMTVVVGDLDRLPDDVESSAYLVIAEALSAAVQRGAGDFVVRLSLNGPRLLIEIEDDAPPPEAPPIRLVDRIGAAGGGLELISRPPAGGTLLRAALPCA